MVTNSGGAGTGIDSTVVTATGVMNLVDGVVVDCTGVVTSTGVMVNMVDAVVVSEAEVASNNMKVEKKIMIEQWMVRPGIIVVACVKTDGISCPDNVGWNGRQLLSDERRTPILDQGVDEVFANSSIG